MLSRPNETEAEREERGQKRVISDEIGALGDILQAAVTISGISVALFGLLKTEKLDVPDSVMVVLFFVVFLAIWASNSSLLALKSRVWNRQDSWFQASWALLLLGILALAGAFSFFVFEVRMR